MPNMFWLALALVALYLSLRPSVPAEARMKAQDLRGRLQTETGLALVDVRTAEEFAGGHLKGAKNIPLDRLTERSSELAKDRPVVLYCYSGSRSASALRALQGLGFSQVKHLQGGILAWQREGLPLD